jgi:hypothetical protein
MKRTKGFASVALLCSFALAAVLGAGVAIVTAAFPDRCSCDFEATWTGTEWVTPDCKERVTCPGKCNESGSSGPNTFCLCPSGGEDACACSVYLDAEGNVKCLADNRGCSDTTKKCKFVTVGEGDTAFPCSCL